MLLSHLIIGELASFMHAGPPPVSRNQSAACHILARLVRSYPSSRHRQLFLAASPPITTIRHNLENEIPYHD